MNFFTSYRDFTVLEREMSVLKKICDDKMDYVRRCEHLIPEIVLEEKAKLQSPPRGFVRHIRAQKAFGHPALIAEIKKASLGHGIIRPDFNPVSIARAYEQGGATCLSVLTDHPYFKGHEEDLDAARQAVQLPVLRKDFMLTPYQVLESRSLGADCILLIMAAIDDAVAGDLLSRATSLGMDTLVEVHDEWELDRALALSPAMIGVNALNLSTLEIDAAAPLNLLRRIPPEVIRVTESGLSEAKELSALHQAGFDAVLAGESLMRQENIAQAVQKLLGTDPESM